MNLICDAAIAPRFDVRVGDCLEVMRTLDANSVDAIVTDPPYGLGFMGKGWDHDVPGEAFWREALRVAKPGAWLVAFGGTRKYHRLACYIEDAGWELRDSMGRAHNREDCEWLAAWVFGSGFPKSHNLCTCKPPQPSGEVDAHGWALCQCGSPYELGTALKPAWEPIILARKPLIGTVAANVLAHGTGALNIDGCRVETADNLNGGAYSAERKPSESEWVKHGGTIHSSTGREYMQPAGRWPANLMHDGSKEVVDLFPREAGAAAPVHRRNGDKFRNTFGTFAGDVDEAGGTFQGDRGSAARFFYCPKASRKDRNDGCERMEERPLLWSSGEQSPGTFQAEGTKRAANNNHPTVKPTELMRWLCRLVTPPGGLVLDPFAGSGSTGRGAVLEGFRFTGIELDPDYAAIAEARIRAALPANDNRP